jgi:hypothetical protein
MLHSHSCSDIQNTKREKITVETRTRHVVGLSALQRTRQVFRNSK